METFSHYLQYSGINWMIPVFSVYLVIIGLGLLGIYMSFSLVWATVAICLFWGLLLSRSVVTRSARQQERELAVILRPFHSRIKQGAHPMVALADVYGFLERGTVLEQQFDSIISFQGGRKESGDLLRNVASSSPSPVVERFWLAFALALITKAEIELLIDELVLQIYKN